MIKISMDLSQATKAEYDTYMASRLRVYMVEEFASDFFGCEVQVESSGGPHSIERVDSLVPLVGLFSDEDSAPKLTAFFVSTYAEKLGEAPTQAQVKKIKDAVAAMVQFPPRHRTLDCFTTLLQDPDVIFACSSAIRDSEALERYEHCFK
ncbi:hypothetical protein [Pseudomonas fluorescens]|uniref:Uncharacterized protein n=1 Tax=Pseudomonas fluorescens TaxID=294 RepID=A0A5E7FSY0_PSEFL|nr:hypothetical protein [Pseudomonas fluorescens]VVO41864.1 hypothetical protein PS691_05817 [Pseudomonas fluorescens]